MPHGGSDEDGVEVIEDRDDGRVFEPPLLKFLCLERSVYLEPSPNVHDGDLPGRLRIRDPKEVALPGTVRLRSAIRHMPEPSLWPFFTHFCCVAERWADTRGDDRALRPIADTSGAAASANERTST